MDVHCIPSSSVTVSLTTEDMWKRFKGNLMEMIVTKSGRFVVYFIEMNWAEFRIHSSAFRIPSFFVFLSPHPFDEQFRIPLLFQ